MLRVLKVQIRCSSDHSFFSKVSTEDSNGRSDIGTSVLSFLGFTVDIDVEVDAGSARFWLLATRYLRLTAWQVYDVSDCAILLLRYLLGVGFVERLETILCAGALTWPFSLQPLMLMNSA